MSFKPTEGEWRSGRVVWVEGDGGGQRHIAIDGPDYMICLVQCDEDDDEQAANVQLLVNAKRLLEACLKYHAASALGRKNGSNAQSVLALLDATNEINNVVHEIKTDPLEKA